MKVLLIGDIHEDARHLLEEHCEVTFVSREDFAASEAHYDVEAVVLRTFTTLGVSELARFSNLKYVVSCSVGINNLDLAGLKEWNIELIHCAGTNANSVAEHVMYLLYSLLRKKAPFAELAGKRVGIMGFGHIGKLVAQKLQGSEAQLVAFDVIEQDPAVLEELGVTMVSTQELFSTSDIVTIHVPLNKHTHGLIGEKEFGALKQGAFFINTSREEVINEEALVGACEKLRGIGLDVYSDELLRRLDSSRVVATNHVAAQGEDSYRKMCIEPIEKLIALLN